MAFDIGGLLAQYLGGNTANPQDAGDHFHQVSQAASPDLLSQGLAAMFRSDQTPAFGQMAGQLFGQANGGQQAGMLNQLLGSMGPGVLASLLGGAGGAGLSGILGQLTQGAGAAPTLTAEQASRLTPEQVQQIASHAEQNNGGVVEVMSSFYAEHTTLVKTLGGAALSIALAKMAEHNRTAG